MPANASTSYRITFRPLAALVLTGLVCACVLLTGSHTPTALERVQQAGELTIISRNGATTYYESVNGLDGYEYALTKAFAEYLGVNLAIVDEENLAGIFDQLRHHKGDLGAAGLTVTKQRQQITRFTAPYLQVTQQLIYRRGTNKPESIEDLYGKTLLVISNSAHSETLRQLQSEYPGLRWHEQSDVEMVDLVEMVHRGEIDASIVDSNAYDLHKHLFPRARVAFDVSEPQALAWALPISSDDSLLEQANLFLAQAQESGLLDQINRRFFQPDDTLDTGSALTFTHRLETRLPQWEELLRNAAEEFQLDWQLLAALSYQESHWNPRARSYTGVRGMMMLTRTTAKEMGVSNRLDPVQSIYGGAKYFRKIYDRIPADIQGMDRTWFALAAYNVGFGHLEDARVLTERQGGDPDQWDDVVQRLPLLAKRKYYRTLKHGYARGSEPVKYVQSIRGFYATIAWHEQLKTHRLASSEDGANEDGDDTSSPVSYASEETLLHPTML